MEEYRWQVASDIHLEFYDKHDRGRITPEVFLKPAAPNLALCGDIGYPTRPAYRAFLEWCSQHYELVVLTSGNHEYYTSQKSVNEIDMLIAEICARFPNVYFLQKGILQTPKARILGCTLWSYISPQNRYDAQASMNDYSKIPFWTVDSCRNVHADHVAWLEKEIKYSSEHNEPTIILTHHLPSYEFIHPVYKSSPGNYNFATNLEHLIRPPVEAWFCGHTHKPTYMVWNGVRCVVNPFGYPHENKTTDIRQCYVTMTLPVRTGATPPLRPKTPPIRKQQDDGGSRPEDCDFV